MTTKFAKLVTSENSFKTYFVHFETGNVKQMHLMYFYNKKWKTLFLLPSKFQSRVGRFNVDRTKFSTSFSISITFAKYNEQYGLLQFRSN